jgi:hypothetical protein
VGRAMAGELFLLVIRQLEVEVSRNPLLYRLGQHDELIAERGPRYEQETWLRR